MENWFTLLAYPQRCAEGALGSCGYYPVLRCLLKLKEWVQGKRGAQLQPSLCQGACTEDQDELCLVTATVLLPGMHCHGRGTPQSLLSFHPHTLSYHAPTIVRIECESHRVGAVVPATVSPHATSGPALLPVTGQVLQTPLLGPPVPEVFARVSIKVPEETPITR
jgi:hypothetical protein